MTSRQRDDPDVRAELDGAIGTLTILRPPVNAFRTGTFEDFGRSLRELQRNPVCKVIVLRSGVPRVFCAGADRNETMSADHAETRQELVRRTLAALLRSPQPVVCAIDGAVRGGGCSLAACCDIRVASRRSDFALPEIRSGKAGGGRHLMRVLPQGEVRLAYFTGRSISAADAYRLGMVQALAADRRGAADLLARSIAEEIAVLDGTALRAAKEALDLAEGLGVADGYHVEQQFTLKLGLRGGPPVTHDQVTP